MPTPDAPAPPPGEALRTLREFVQTILGTEREQYIGSLCLNWSMTYQEATATRIKAEVHRALDTLERGLTVARDAPDVGMIPASSYDEAVRVVGQLEINVRSWRERAERMEAGRDAPKLTEAESVEAHAIYVRLCDQGDPYALVRTIEHFLQASRPGEPRNRGGA